MGPVVRLLFTSTQTQQPHHNETHGVGTLGMGADGSYNQSQMQDLINKVDELIHALRR